MSVLLLASILGFIQAVTEFLPISSSGHLILAREFFNFDPKIFNLSFDIILHFGTLLALIVFFWKDLKEMTISLFKKGADKKLFYAIVLATIPAVLIGLLFSDFIEKELRGSLIVVLMLVIFGIIFIFVENISSKTKGLKDIKSKDAVLIGGAQAVSLIPGVSRSGITIVTGLFLGFKREEAAKFSFLLSIPTIFLVSLKDIYDLSKSNFTFPYLNVYLVGLAVSAIASFLVIKFFLNYLKKHTLKPFAYYRFALALLFLLFV